jgi:hypothetical protein
MAECKVCRVFRHRPSALSMGRTTCPMRKQRAFDTLPRGCRRLMLLLLVWTPQRRSGPRAIGSCCWLACHSSPHILQDRHGGPPMGKIQSTSTFSSVVSSKLLLSNNIRPPFCTICAYELTRAPATPPTSSCFLLPLQLFLFISCESSTSHSLPQNRTIRSIHCIAFFEKIQFFVEDQFLNSREVEVNLLHT